MPRNNRIIKLDVLTKKQYVHPLNLDWFLKEPIFYAPNICITCHFPTTLCKLSDQNCSLSSSKCHTHPVMTQRMLASPDNTICTNS